MNNNVGFNVGFGDIMQSAKKITRETLIGTILGMAIGVTVVGLYEFGHRVDTKLTDMHYKYQIRTKPSKISVLHNVNAPAIENEIAVNVGYLYIKSDVQESWMVDAQDVENAIDSDQSDETIREIIYKHYKTIYPLRVSIPKIISLRKGWIIIVH